jgi:hypothetical protein
VPYKREGSTILKQEKDGTWRVKDHCKASNGHTAIENAQRQLRLLLAVEHGGWRPADK